MKDYRIILKFLTGSHLYGTNTPTSDKDFVSVFMPTEDELLGLREEHIIEDRTNPGFIGSKKNTFSNRADNVDHTYYSLHKFAELARQNNPNIIELLFAPKRNVLECDRIGEMFLDSRDLFVSNRCYNTFKGYAQGQRKKLETKKTNMTGRQDLVKWYGYDTKFASHLIRILFEGTQLLTEGFITFPLGNTKTLKDIRSGSYSMMDLLEEMKHSEKVMDIAYANCKLPNYKDTFKPINELVIDLTRRAHGHGIYSSAWRREQGTAGLLRPLRFGGKNDPDKGSTSDDK